LATQSTHFTTRQNEWLQIHPEQALNALMRGLILVTMEEEKMKSFEKHIYQFL